MWELCQLLLRVPISLLRRSFQLELLGSTVPPVSFPLLHRLPQSHLKKDPKMQVIVSAFFCFVAVTLANPIAHLEDDPPMMTVEELNNYVDDLITSVRHSPVMLMLDPLLFPDQHRAVEHGSYRLLRATATGLSTLSRLGDVSYVHADDDDDNLLTLTVVMATQSVRVAAQLVANTNSDESSYGKIHGTLEPLQVVLQIQISRQRTVGAKLISYTINSHLHPLAERYSGKTEGKSEELLSIVRDAIDYGFNFVYGINIEKVVEGALRQQVTLALEKVNY